LTFEADKKAARPGERTSWARGTLQFHFLGNYRVFANPGGLQYSKRRTGLLGKIDKGANMRMAILAAIVVLAVNLSSTKGQPPRPRMEVDAQRQIQWEYRVLTKDQLLNAGKKDLAAALNRLGSQGWELVAIETALAPSTFYFKRPRQSLAEQIEDYKARVAGLELAVALARDRADWAERMTRKGNGSESNLTVANQQLKFAELALERARKRLSVLSSESIDSTEDEKKPAK